MSILRKSKSDIQLHMQL